MNAYNPRSEKGCVWIARIGLVETANTDAEAFLGIPLSGCLMSCDLTGSQGFFGQALGPRFLLLLGW